MDSFEANRTLESDPSLHLGSPNHELSFELFSFWFKPVDFPSKMVLCKISLNLSLFGLGPSSKGHASNFWLSAVMIVLFHWTLDLGPESKVALSLHPGGHICF